MYYITESESFRLTLSFDAWIQIKDEEARIRVMIKDN